MSERSIPGRHGGEAPKEFVLDRIDLSIIQYALRGDVEMWRYVPEVMSLYARLDIKEPPWMEDEAIRERVEMHRAEWPRRDGGVQAT
jgi:hypothetical protein